MVDALDGDKSRGDAAVEEDGGRPAVDEDLALFDDLRLHLPRRQACEQVDQAKAVVQVLERVDEAGVALLDEVVEGVLLGLRVEAGCVRGVATAGGLANLRKGRRVGE